VVLEMAVILLPGWWCDIYSIRKWHARIEERWPLAAAMGKAVRKWGTRPVHNRYTRNYTIFDQESSRLL